MLPGSRVQGPMHRHPADTHHLSYLIGAVSFLTQGSDTRLVDGSLAALVDPLGLRLGDPLCLTLLEDRPLKLCHSAKDGQIQLRRSVCAFRWKRQVVLDEADSEGFSLDGGSTLPPGGPFLDQPPEAGLGQTGFAPGFRPSSRGVSVVVASLPSCARIVFRGGF